MHLRARAAVLALVLACAGSAAADSGVAVGPVLQQSDTGWRGGLDSGLLLVAGERYQLVDTTRTRAEIALRIRIHLTRRLTIEPQLGVIPVDYATSPTDTRFRVSGTGTIRFGVKLAGPLALAIEPLRLEARAVEVIIPEPRTSIPTVDEEVTWQLGAWIALRVGW